MSEWISVKDQLPPLPETWRENNRWLASDGRTVREMRYAQHATAKTEKGRKPRWEETDGRLAWIEVTHWQPLPAPPSE